jgi:hypothetical protein
MASRRDSMTMDNPTLRQSVYGLLLVVAVGMAFGHIVSAQRVYEPAQNADASGRRAAWPTTRPALSPMFGSNDRSRWATVAALADNGTYAIGERDVKKLYGSVLAPLGQLDPTQAAALAGAGYFTRVNSDSGIIFEDGWQSVDKVLDPSTMQYYSSKPPLLATLVAGLYWILKLITGWRLTAPPGQPTQVNEIVRTLLLLINGVPFAIYLWQLARIAEMWGKTDWGRLYVFAAGAFATLVGPFLMTFSNHTPGTFAVMFAWLSLLRISQHTEGPPPWYHFAAAGFFAAFAAANELPALAFTAAVFALLLWWYPRRALLLALPPALVVAAAFIATNYAALGTWRVAYSNTDSVWYQYEGSHWRLAPDQTKYGIDWARRNGESPVLYALHVIVGHHGWFSLTPIWVLAAAAMVVGVSRLRVSGRQPPHVNPQAELPWFVHPLGLALSIVVVGFYLYRSDNYGGWTQGLRWLMWLTPLWLTSLLPIADRLAESRWGRSAACALLAVSIFSASYEPWNPWRHPWLYDLMQEMGWPGY